MFILNWNDRREGYSEAYFGVLKISCTAGRKYKDGSNQFMIYLRAPSADSREIITLTKVRGCLEHAKLEAERFLQLNEVLR